jgi:tRNA(His) 5'-end guanylyltransferase
MNLLERMQRYENTLNGTLLYRAPIIARFSIRNYGRLIRQLPRPYSAEFMRILQETMFSTVKELEGAVFAYQQHGEISYVLRQIGEDGAGPYGGLVQKISTTLSSITTLNFAKHYMSSDEPPDIVGEAIFEGIVFNVSTVSEAINYLIGQQYICQRNAITIIAEDNLSPILANRRTVDEKKELLEAECGIVFDEVYNNYFKYGSSAFKAPKIRQDVARKKWVLEETAPDFITEKEFVMNVVKTGQDIFRPERDIQNT